MSCSTETLGVGTFVLDPGSGGLELLPVALLERDRRPAQHDELRIRGGIRELLDLEAKGRIAFRLERGARSALAAHHQGQED